MKLFNRLARYNICSKLGMLTRLARLARLWARLEKIYGYRVAGREFQAAGPGVLSLRSKDLLMTDNGSYMNPHAGGLRVD